MAFPDLAVVHADSLRFWCNLPVTRDQIDQLRDALGRRDPYRDLPFVFGRRCRKGGSFENEVAWFVEEDSKVTLTVEYTVEDSGPVPRGIKSFYWLLLQLTGFGLKPSINCLVNFEYPNKEWRSVIPLPLRLIESEALPFDELRGVRAVKLRDGEVAYSLILDQAKNGNHTHLASFAYESTVNISLPERILEEGVKISLLFIKPTEQ